MPDSSPSTFENPWLARYAKLVVAAGFWLIFTGGHTTTSGAGMAFPDWPLSNGSLNPTGWLTDTFMLLEHGHRLTASTVGLLVTGLFIWVFRRRESLPSGTVGLALFALLGVIAQGFLGGLRVMLDPQGIWPTTSAIATTFRVLHGCFAQIELCLLVAIAAILSPVWRELRPSASAIRVARLGWITAVIVFFQLIVGATMRHLGAGLAIPSFPLTPEGKFMPAVHNIYTDLNFTHTRFGALVVTGFVIWLVVRTLRLGAKESRLTDPALLLLGLLTLQVCLGMFVIWHFRPLVLTTIHVVNGAAVLATTVLLAVRAGRTPSSITPRYRTSGSEFAEASL